VQQSREEAEQAVQLIPEIEKHIRDAENSTYWALAALHNADSYALAAEELALAAKNKSSTALAVRDSHLLMVTVTVITVTIVILLICHFKCKWLLYMAKAT